MKLLLAANTIDRMPKAFQDVLEYKSYDGIHIARGVLWSEVCISKG